MISARLDQKISIQAVTTGKSGTGATTESWAVVSGAPEWAEYIPLRGNERIEAGKAMQFRQISFAYGSDWKRSFFSCVFC